MKVEVNEQSVGKSPYPRLMISDNGLIVLFTKFEHGFVVYSPEDYTFGEGYHSSTWAMDNFREFTGSVTFSND